MSAEENKAVIRRLFDEVFNGQNFDVLEELVAQDVVTTQPSLSTSAVSRASGTSWSGELLSPPMPTTS